MSNTNAGDNVVRPVEIFELEHTRTPANGEPEDHLSGYRYYHIRVAGDEHTKSMFLRDSMKAALEKANDFDALSLRVAELEGALRGAYPEAPEIGPLSWLKSGIDELKARGPHRECEDPDAFWEMVTELESFHATARALLSKETPSREEGR